VEPRTARAPQGGTAVAILPGEVSFAARIYQNGLPAPLARGRGAPRTQLGHSVTWAAFSARLDEVSARCWLVTPSPRQCEAPRAHTTRALSVLRVCGWTLVPRTAHPRVGSTRVQFTWGHSVLRRVSGRAVVVRRTTNLPDAWSSPRASAHTVRACREGAGRPHATAYISSTHGPEGSTPSDSALTRAIPASLHAPHDVRICNNLVEFSHGGVRGATTGGADHIRSSLSVVLSDAVTDAAPVSTAAVASSRPRLGSIPIDGPP